MATKEKTFDDISQRVIYDEVGEQFQNALGVVYDTVPENIPVILKGFQINGETGDLEMIDGIFDSGDMRPMISKLTKRVQGGTDKDGKTIYEQVCRAVVVSPVPTLNALMNHVDGPAWLESKLATEFNQITMRPLREAENLTDADLPAKMPKNIDDFLNAKRSGGAAQNEAFSEYWKDALDALKNHAVIGKLVTDANIRKAMFEKVLKNRAYALAFYANLENANVFAGALSLIIQAGQGAGMDTTILENWRDTRNEQTYEVEDIDLSSLDLSDLVLADDSEDVTPEAETAPTEAENVVDAPEAEGNHPKPAEG